MPKTVIIKTTVAAALLAAVSACHEPGHTTDSGAPPIEPFAPGVEQQRFAPDPSEFTGEDLGAYDQPDEYIALCNDDGTVANYWPDTASGWQEAVTGCQGNDEYAQLIADEFNRRDPGAGWH